MLNQHPHVVPVEPADPMDDLSRMIPHSVDAEMCLLASLMLCANDPVVWAGVADVVDRDSFFQGDHQIIFGVLADMRKRRQAIDAVTLVDALKSRDVYDEVGGTAYIGTLLNTVPSHAHWQHYARIVANKAKRRDLIRLAGDAIKVAREAYDDGELDAGIAATSRGVAQLATVGKARDVHLIGDLCGRAYADREKPTRLIPTGIDTLDRMFGGLAIGHNTLVGGRPSHGKSALIKQWGLNISASGIPFGLITVEETGDKIAVNMMSNRSGVVNARLAYHRASPDEWDRVRDVLGDLGALPFYVVDSATSLSAIVGMAERLAVQHGCKVIAVDHVHIVNGEPGRGESREQTVGKISAELKRLWKQLDVAGICCCQLNRGAAEERPTMSNLRDSGTLEQDGDTIVLVHREDVRRKQTGDPGLDGLAEAIVVKNKTGGCGTAILKMDEARQRIEDRPEQLDPSIQHALDAFGSPDLSDDR